MKKVIINKLLKFESLLKTWFKHNNDINKVYIYKGFQKFLKVQKLYRDHNQSLNSLIKKYYSGKQQYYIWKEKAINVINRNWDFKLAGKLSTRPKNIHYKYSENFRKWVSNLIAKFKKDYGTGIYEFYYLTKTGFFKYNNKKISCNIKTLIKWNNFFNTNYEKKVRKNIHKRYEVNKLGLIQHDIKVLTPDLTGLKKPYYVFDFIDEKSRYAFAYIYDSKGVTNAIAAANYAINEFENIGIRVERIRTDNGAEYVTYLNKHIPKIESEFTRFLKKKGIVHETTPIRSPQSNGKIERFHQNWNKFFIQTNPTSLNELRQFSKTFLRYYNKIRPHKSLGLKTPEQMVHNLIRQ